MPKEYVGVNPQQAGSIAVMWGRVEECVRLSVAGPIGWRDNIRRSDSLDPDNDLDWHFAACTRSEVNKLIATLRKARDQAFGRDE